MTHAAGPGASTVARAMAPALEAVVLFSTYALGYPWFYAWLMPRLPQRPGSWLIVEASTLVLVVLMVGALGRRTRGGTVSRGGGEGWRDGCAVASSALFVLGVLALVLRVVDPAFDAQELDLRSLGSLAALVEFLLVLPFGAAAEELVFRACQRRLRSRLGRVPTVLAVGLAFALFHWVPGAALHRHAIETLISTFAGGVVLAAAFERRSSVRLLVAIHLVYDYLAVGQAWLNVSDATLVEAGLFALWIGATGGLAWRLRGRDVAGSDDGGPGHGEPAIASEPAPGDHPASGARVLGEWIAAAAFGAGLPLLIGWIRLRLG